MCIFGQHRLTVTWPEERMLSHPRTVTRSSASLPRTTLVLGARSRERLQVPSCCSRALVRHSFRPCRKFCPAVKHTTYASLRQTQLCRGVIGAREPAVQARSFRSDGRLVSDIRPPCDRPPEFGHLSPSLTFYCSPVAATDADPVHR